MHGAPSARRSIARETGAVAGESPGRWRVGQRVAGRVPSISVVGLFSATRGLAALAVAFLFLLASCSPATSSVPATEDFSPAASVSSTDSSPVSSPGAAAWTVAENAKAGTQEWRIGEGLVATDAELAGYADTTSVLPGQSFGLYVTSTLGAVTVDAYRVGSYGGAGGRRVWQSQPFAGVRQSDPVIEPGNMVVAKWDKSLDVPTTGWPEGSYLLKLTASGRSRYVVMMVRSPSTAGRLVLLSAVTTHQAYNTWGGFSLYRRGDGQRAVRVSFDRPMKGNGAGEYFIDELTAIQFIEGLGLPLGYLTSVDLDRDADVLQGASGLVSLGHDEYWSVPMRTHAKAALDRGTSLAFLGANALYWRVRLEDGLHGDRRVQVNYRDANADPEQDSPETTVKWRSRPNPEPENSLTGMMFECVPGYGAMTIQDPAFAFFAGTGVKKGDTIPGVIGMDIDRAYPIKGTAPTLTVVAHSQVQCGDRLAYSDMTYYSTGKAGVWATGTMAWMQVLAGPSSTLGTTEASVAFVRKVTENGLREMAKGQGHGGLKTRPNLAELNASKTPNAGSGGGGPIYFR